MRPQLRQTHTFATLEISARAFAEIKKKLKDAKYDHSFVDDTTIDMHGIGLVPAPKKQPIRGKLMTGKELRFAATNELPVYYVETHYNPSDKHMNFRKKCVMQKCGLSTSAYYIGDSDIDLIDWDDDTLVTSSFDGGDYAVYKINGVRYK